MMRLAAGLAGLLTLMATAESPAEPNYAVWRIAHERMLARWRCSEPRCGWTVGGYTCSSRAGTRSSRVSPKAGSTRRHSDPAG
jgi:hypothetical protein